MRATPMLPVPGVWWPDRASLVSLVAAEGHCWKHNFFINKSKQVFGLYHGSV